MIDEISKKIRKFRKEKGYTLKDLSKKTDLSISFLSQVERGNSTLAITSLKKISEALNVSITEFFKTDPVERFQLKKSDQKTFKIEGCDSILTKLSGVFPKRNLESMLIEIPKKSQHGHEFNHIGEEFVYILEGELTVTIAEKEYLLSKGDSIHYPSSLNHSWKNNSSSSTKILTINTPIIFG